MHKLMELRDCLVAELEEFSKKKDNLDMESLKTIDTLAHTIKNIDKILNEGEESEYSGRSYSGYSRANEGGYSNAGGYSNGMSYNNSGARGRGLSARRDSMGRYSMADDIRRLMDSAPDEQTRAELSRIASRYE